jgi:hypothetical protein
MSAAEWIFFSVAIAFNVIASWSFYLASMKSEKETAALKDYVRKANADFAEAAALLQYGAVQEAVELLRPYAHEETE